MFLEHQLQFSVPDQSRYLNLFIQPYLVHDGEADINSGYHTQEEVERICSETERSQIK